MPKKNAMASAVLALAASALAAQSTVDNVPVGVSYSTDGAHAVSGVNIRVLPDGTVWFMVPSSDRIVLMQGTTFKQWQIRPDASIGANPVKFELDGDVMWFICNGESLIDAGRSIFARLDTVTGALREWVLPGSKPAGFWRAPGGLVWLAQTDGRLQSLDLDSLQVVDYRSRSADGKVFTFAYSGIAYGPDGALWMTDFGNNRIVRFEPGADTETSWTFLDPNLGRFNPSQIQFDQDGRLWICQLLGNSIDMFDPATNLLATYTGFLSPIHFEMFQGHIYVAEAPGTNAQVAVLDPRIAFPGGSVLASLTVPVHHVVNAKPALIRDSVITPTTFTSTATFLGNTDMPVTLGAAGSGILRMQFTGTNAFGITVAGGFIWTGSTGAIVRLQLQNIGADQDLAVPIVFEEAANSTATLASDRVDVTLANMGGSTISGNLLYLYSPAALTASVPFSVNPNSTAVVEDIFHDVLGQFIFVNGPVRVQVVSGTASDLSASVRNAHTRDDGAAFGFVLQAVDTTACLGVGDQATLFLGVRDAETTTLGLFTSSAGAGSQGTLSLVGADGTVRGILPYNLSNNTSEEFNPAASAFGLPARAGDSVLINGGPGSLRAYTRIVDSGSTDAALSLPARALGDAVLPYAITGLNAGGIGPISDLFLSNPNPANPANVVVSYFASGAPAPPLSVAVTLAPGSTQVTADVLQTLFSVTSGSGTLLISSDTPIASAVRVAARQSDGDYATMLNGYPGSLTVPPGSSSFASGLQEIPGVRSTDLVLFNRRDPTTVTVVGFDGNGGEISRFAVNLGTGESRRLAAILHTLNLDGPGEIRNARVRLDALPGTQIYAAFIQTDAVSGDMEFMAPLPQQPAAGAAESNVGRSRIVANRGHGRGLPNIPHR
jgi:streptogramin lyase